MQLESNMVLLIASGLGALALTTFVLWVLDLLSADRGQTRSRYEGERRNALRAQSKTYRYFEPFVDELKQFFPYESAEDLDSLGHVLSNSPDYRHWSPQEFRAAKLIEGGIVGLMVFILVAPTGYVAFAGVLFILLFLFYPTLTVRSAAKQQKLRIKTLRLRLPMVVDQLALMMEAGGNFEDSLRTVVAEDRSHPLNVELSSVLNSIDAGRSRRESLVDLKDRLPDADISELVFAITKGEELGTPLSSILSEQAEQMRLKRSQWGEKAAAEAEVQIVFPGMLVMIACLIVIIAPILLPAAFNVFSQ